MYNTPVSKIDSKITKLRNFLRYLRYLNSKCYIEIGKVM